MPGGFHPFHAGHLALYKSAVKAFPGADVYVAASDNQKDRPFPFKVKEALATVAGIPKGKFVQVKSPFRPEEITKHYDATQDALIFVRSEKDRSEQPKPGGTKKDGSPTYYQAYDKKNLKPFAEQGYIAYLPTVEFADGMTSATEIRNAWPTLDELGKIELIKSMYPEAELSVPKVKKLVQMLDAVLVGELTESNVVDMETPMKAEFINWLKTKNLPISDLQNRVKLRNLRLQYEKESGNKLKETFVDPDQSKQYWNHDDQLVGVGMQIDMPLRDNDRRGRRQGYNEGEDTEILDEVAFLAPAVWSAARVAAPWLLKQGWKIIKGTSKVAIKNPKSAIAVGTGIAYKDEIEAVAEYLESIGETIEPVLKYAKQYALPVMAVFALMYGGKKIIDMVTREERQGFNEGEERSIIRDAAINALVNAFEGHEDEFESREAIEANIYSVLSDLNVEDIVDPEMDHHGQRMGNFASGRVIDVVDSSSVIDEVMQQLNYFDPADDRNYVSESLNKIRGMIKETTDEQKSRSVDLHRKLFELMEEERDNVIKLRGFGKERDNKVVDISKARQEKQANQERENNYYSDRRDEQDELLARLQAELLNAQQEFEELEQAGLLPIEMLDTMESITKLIDYIENWSGSKDQNDFPFTEDLVEKLHLKTVALKEYFGGMRDRSAPRVLRKQKPKTNQFDFWNKIDLSETADYIEEK